MSEKLFTVLETNKALEIDAGNGSPLSFITSFTLMVYKDYVDSNGNLRGDEGPSIGDYGAIKDTDYYGVISIYDIRVILWEHRCVV